MDQYYTYNTNIDLQSIWEENDSSILSIRQHCHMSGRNWHECIISYIASEGLYGFARLSIISIDHALVTALVERSRQETYTFYLSVDKATGTSQDVAVFLGCKLIPVITPIMQDV